MEANRLSDVIASTLSLEYTSPSYAVVSAALWNKAGFLGAYINSAGLLVAPLGITSTAGTTLTLSGALVGSVQALTAAGAVNLTTSTTTIASSGAIALTLADGTAGQLKTISMITDGGDATLTPTNLQGGTTLTFNDVGDTVLLQFLGTKWAIVSNTGATLA